MSNDGLLFQWKGYWWIIKETKVNDLQLGSERFVNVMLQHRRRTRQLVLEKGDIGQIPQTKISGVPWWPKGIPRPKCNRGHNMSFIIQILLSDIPSFGKYKNTLMSFHYCNLCSRDGNMTLGWHDPEHRGYDVCIFVDINGKEPDSIGIIQEPIVIPYDVNFREVNEVPGSYEDAGLNCRDIPRDYPQNKNDFDENIYPDLVHISKSKIGGWPTWVQSPEWPEPKENVTFVCQLDWWTFDRAPWAIGGYSYLFLREDRNGLSGGLCIQVT